MKVDGKWWWWCVIRNVDGKWGWWGMIKKVYDERGWWGVIMQVDGEWRLMQKKFGSGDWRAKNFLVVGIGEFWMKNNLAKNVWRLGLNLKFILSYWGFCEKHILIVIIG